MGKQSSKPKGSPVNKPLELREEVGKVYECAEGVLMIFSDSEFGFIDLSAIDLEFAHRLADRGYLVKKEL